MNSISSCCFSYMILRFLPIDLEFFIECKWQSLVRAAAYSLWCFQIFGLFTISVAIPVSLHVVLHFRMLISAFKIASCPMREDSSQLTGFHEEGQREQGEHIFYCARILSLSVWSHPTYGMDLLQWPGYIQSERSSTHR